MKIITGGRTIMPGIATGEALVTSHSLGFNFGVDGETGYVIEHGHELEGQCLQGKVLIFPNGKGSTGGSFIIYQIVRGGNGPIAMVNVTCESIIAVGAIMAGIPMIDSLSENPLEIVNTGDLVRIDGAAGTLEILCRAEEKEKSA